MMVDLWFSYTAISEDFMHADARNNRHHVYMARTLPYRSQIMH